MSKLIVEIPEELHRELKKKTATSHETIKQVVTRLLNQYLSAEEKRTGKMDETGFCGARQDEQSAEEIVADIKKSRRWFSGEKKLA